MWPSETGRSVGWVYLGTAHCSDSCYVTHLVLAEIMAKITAVVTIHYSIVHMPIEDFGFYGAQSLHHWEGLQNFFLLSADFSELSLFPSDHIYHRVPSSFLNFVVTFSAICEICIPLFVTAVVTVLFPQSLRSDHMTSRGRKHRSFISHQ